MTEETKEKINIEKMLEMNYRLISLLGMATSIICRSCSKRECDWFLRTTQEVVYKNNPITEFNDEDL
jgi:hypothetical protein